MAKRFGAKLNSSHSANVGQRRASIGIFKPPVAAGRATGTFKYSIVPGHPDQSILLYRMISGEPDIMMPESGRALAHQEGIDLIREWITAME